MTHPMKRLSRALAITAAVAATLAVAQPLPPPPIPPGASPSGAAPAPPPAPPGTLTPLPAGMEARASEAPESRWQGELNRLDADLRLRLMTAHEPRSEWLAGELEGSDVESQVRHYAAARTAAPDEPLYQASLATACLVRVRPPLAPCDALDRLADWARRDGGNGLPSVLLADRARQRGEPDLAVQDIEQAAAAARFDDYWSQGALRWWEYLRPLPVAVDPAAKAKAAADYALMRDLRWTSALRALCAETAGRSAPMKAACAKLGEAMMARGATFALRRAGARVAEINAPDAGARAAAQLGQARLLEETARCALAQPDFATTLESPDAATRARGVEQFGAWAQAQAREGEVGACAKAIAAAPAK